jgi:electron transfer flavoprotein alpha subunit
MGCVLYLAHTADGKFTRPALEGLTAAREIAGLTGLPLTTGLVGTGVEAAAASLAGTGVSRFLAVEGDPYANGRYHSDAAAAEALCRSAQPAFVVVSGTSRWSRVLAGAAYRLGGAVDTHVCGWRLESGELAVTRWYYRQRMKGVLSRTRRPWLLAVDPGVCPAAELQPGSADVTKVMVTDSPSRTHVEAVKEPPAAQQTIRPDADLLFVAGAGWTKKQRDGQHHLAEAEQLILEFLRLSQASLGGSKSMVDLNSEGQKVLSFMTHLNQVGQTGSSPRHPKGLAACCHGEEPHVVGWRFINERRAINIDPNCGWAQGKADVLYVADAFEVMAKVNELLAQR